MMLLLVRCYNIITIIRCRTRDDNRKTLLVIILYLLVFISYRRDDNENEVRKDKTKIITLAFRL